MPEPSRLLLVSTDNHAGLPTAEYRPFVGPRYRKAFDEFVSTVPRIPGWATGSPDRDDEASQYSLDGLWDPHLRIKRLESDGIVAEVVFPNAHSTVPPFAQRFGQFRGVDRQLATQGAKAYNRWLAEFCGAYPGRMAGLALVPWHDPRAAVKEIRRAADEGLRGVILETNDPALPLYCEACYEPIWDVCEELHMPVHTHGGTGAPSIDDRPVDPLVGVLLAMTEAGFWARRPLWHFVWGGVLERHPGLKAVFTEQGATWVTTTLPHLDFLYESKAFTKVTALKSAFPHRPSEYWRRQCFAGASFISKREAELRHEIGVSTLMFGVDYPHQEGTWGRTARWLRLSLGAAGASEQEVRQIVGGNAIRCYGFDPVALTAVADRVGPELASVLTAAPGPEPGDDESFVLLTRPADA